MEGPRPPFDEELNDFVAFLSRNLRPKADWSIAEEYPLAIHNSNLNNIRVIKDDTSFLSAAVMKPLLIKSPAGLYKAAAIGSVVTDPSKRNQGLSRQVLENCLEGASAHGCDFAILWTNLFEFYRKIGFEMAGTEVSLRLERPFEAENPGLHFRQTNQVDPEAILRVYSNHTCGSLRSADEIRKYLKIPNARVFTAWDANNVLKAYAVEGKGADLDGYIHEWGGSVSSLLPLFHHMLEVESRPLTLIAGRHSENLIKQLEERGARKFEGILGMIKLLNVPNVLYKVKRYVRALGYDRVILERQNDRYYLGQNDQVFSTDSESDIIRLIFGPQKAGALYPFEPALKEVFETIFPVPLWIWGWDSV